MTNNARLLALMATVSYCRAQEVRDEGDQKRSCVLMGCWAHVFWSWVFFFFLSPHSLTTLLVVVSIYLTSPPRLFNR
jgi:hypothetical protein